MTSGNAEKVAGSLPLFRPLALPPYLPHALGLERGDNALVELGNVLQREAVRAAEGEGGPHPREHGDLRGLLRLRLLFGCFVLWALQGAALDGNRR
eukprot:1182182-Prorocentrum_minimum.AAC.3